MSKTEIISKKAPNTIGPYSQAVKIGDLIFCSGQIAIDPRTGNLVNGGVKEQTLQVMENLKSVVQAGGSSLENIVKTTVFLQDMDDFPMMNEVYEAYFHKPFPARATIAVSKLPKGALVEIECIAFISKEGCCGGCC